VQRFLKDETLFHGVSQGAIERLGEIALQKVVPKDAVFFSMGQTCEALHFLVEGCGALVKLAPDGRQRILHRAVVGDMVGCVPFFDGGDYPATFVAESECIFVSFHRDQLLQMFSGNPDMSLAIMGGLVERLRMMASLVEQASFEDVEHRLWDYLKGTSTPAGAAEYPRVLDDLPTREFIASSIGTVREVVSRRLSRLSDSGHLKIDGRRLVLLRPLH
jgi:CRP-like cAMP-binding protein